MWDAWRKEILKEQKIVEERYTNKFHTYEEAIPTLREDYPLFFANCVFTKHWYSRDIEIAFLPVSDKIASAWLRDCIAK